MKDLNYSMGIYYQKLNHYISENDGNVTDVIEMSKASLDGSLDYIRLLHSDDILVICIYSINGVVKYLIFKESQLIQRVKNIRFTLKERCNIFKISFGFSLTENISGFGVCEIVEVTDEYISIIISNSDLGFIFKNLDNYDNYDCYSKILFESNLNLI